MIKRILPMLLAVLLLSATAYAVEPPQADLPDGLTVTDITERQAGAEYEPPGHYPTDIQSKTEDGVKLLLKTFEVGPEVSPADLVESGLVQNDVEYELRDVLRTVAPDEQEKKTVSQTVTVSSDSDKHDDIIALLQKTLDYSADGFSGQLMLDEGSITTDVEDTEDYVRDVEVVWNDHVLLEFANTKLSGLQVRKVDSVTKKPLQGVKFRVTKMTGEFVGDYVTNASGYFAVEDLEPDWYTAFETATIPGYVLDATPQNIQIEKGELAVLDFENRPLAGLQIRKVDAVTRQPLAGVEFKVAELDGRLVGNYTTDEAGIIFVPDLEEGFYVVTEIKGIPGYKPDYAPRNVEVVTGELNVVEYKNQPYPVFTLQKIDADTRQPLEGVRFRFMDKSQREIGIFTTNSLGQIMLTGMDEGTYYVQEAEAKAGYQLDSTVREVALQWGKTTSVEVKNTPMGSLRIRKVDALTGKLPALS